MLITESKLRTIIKEELVGVLIEEGFFDKIGSTVKNAYQKLTGGSKQTQQQSTQSEEELNRPSEYDVRGQKEQIKALKDKDANDMLNGYYFPIKSEADIQTAIQNYRKLNPSDALTRMFKYLLRSITKRQGGIVTEKEKQIYGVLIDDIEKHLKEERSIHENETRKSISSDQEKIEQLKKFMIPASLWGKTAIAFSDFIFDELIGQKKLLLKDLFKDQNLQTSFLMLKDRLKTNKNTTNNVPQAEEQFFGKGGLKERKLKRKK